jgi:serine/threonine protein kinase
VVTCLSTGWCSETKSAVSATLIEKIGDGSFAEVYTARMTSPHGEEKMMIALKIIHKDKPTTSLKRKKKQVRMIAREVQVLERLDSSEHLPYVVQYYGSYADKNNLYIALEHCSMDLFSLVEQFQLSRELVQSITLDVALGVKYLHSLNVIHRDLKLENVLLRPDGHAVIVDFNTSYVGRPPGQEDPMQDSLYCGSLDIIAYEMTKKGAIYGPKVDVWALGCLAYATTAGIVPFPTASIEDKFAPGHVLREILEGAIVDYAPLHSMDADLARFVQQALNFDPDSRPSIDSCLQQPWFANADENALRAARADIALELVPKVNVDKGVRVPFQGHIVKEENSQRFDRVLDELGCHLQPMTIVPQ